MADILHAVLISASPDVVYPLVATAQGFTKWWAADVTETAGSVELGFFNRQTIYRLKVVGSQGPQRADWLCESGQEWAGTHIVFSLEPRANGTQLRFGHRGWKSDTDYFISCNTTWGELMYRLKAEAEGKSPGPLFLRDSLAY